MISLIPVSSVALRRDDTFFFESIYVLCRVLLYVGQFDLIYRTPDVLIASLDARCPGVGRIPPVRRPRRPFSMTLTDTI